MSQVKEKWARGQVATMALANYTSPALVEYLGGLGFDMVLIDCEKGSATTERIEEMCRAARAARIAAIVRPWSADPGLISRYLDLGADGVMVAGVECADSARRVVEAVRHARWQDHERKVVIAMIESPGAIARLEELMTVDGVDAWFVGPNDLAHAMGRPGDAAHPEVRDAVRGVLETVSRAGRVGGTVVSGEVDALLSAGARVLMIRTTDLLARGAAAFHAAVASASGRRGRD